MPLATGRPTVTAGRPVRHLMRLHCGRLVSCAPFMFDPLAGTGLVLARLAMAAADAMGYWKPRGGSLNGTVSSSVLPLVVVVSPLFA